MEMIALRSADGEEYSVNKAMVMEFGVVKFVLEERANLENSEPIPLPNVSGPVLERVIHYCNISLDLHWVFPPSHLLLYFEGVAVLKLRDENNRSIVELVKAADYLEIKVLLAFLMPSFKRRFELGDDKGIDYVYSQDIEYQLLYKAALASEAAGF